MKEEMNDYEKCRKAGAEYVESWNHNPQNPSFIIFAIVTNFQVNCHVLVCLDYFTKWVGVISKSNQ